MFSTLEAKTLNLYKSLTRRNIIIMSDGITTFNFALLGRKAKKIFKIYKCTCMNIYVIVILYKISKSKMLYYDILTTLRMDNWPFLSYFLSPHHLTSL